MHRYLSTSDAGLKLGEEPKSTDLKHLRHGNRRREGVLPLGPARAGRVACAKGIVCTHPGSMLLIGEGHIAYHLGERGGIIAARGFVLDLDLHTRRLFVVPP